MLSKSKISLIRSLTQLKQRREQGLFIAEGPRLMAEILKSGFEVVEIFALPLWCERNERLLKPGSSLQPIDELDLDKISNLVTPNEVLAIVRIPVLPAIGSTNFKGMTLVLDAIRDPGNLGTIIRTADWFGIGNIIVSHDSVDVWNPKVVQASMGSICSVRVHETELSQYLITQKEKVPVLGAMMQGDSLYSVDFPPDFMLVIGNESQGIGQEICALLDRRIAIPAAETTSAESLNASVATAVICSEWARQLKASEK